MNMHLIIIDNNGKITYVTMLKLFNTYSINDAVRIKKSSTIGINK